MRRVSSFCLTTISLQQLRPKAAEVAELHCSALNAMTRTVEEIAADFDSLSDSDFDTANALANGWERLDLLCDELLATNKPSMCVPVLFRAMERLDNEELGNPGPLVHTLESWQGSYETMLAESIRRKPVRLSVWMVNRVLNADPANAGLWLDLLQGVAANPSATSGARTHATKFIEHQTGGPMAASLADLFNHGDDFALCDRLFVRICETRGNGADASALPDDERTVYLVWGSLGVIGNGGFRNLFESEVRGDPEYRLTRHSFEKIGCPEAAEAFSLALASFPNGRPPANQAKRLREYLKGAQSFPSAADRAFFAAQGLIAKSLAKWSRSRQQALMHLA